MDDTKSAPSTEPRSLRGKAVSLDWPEPGIARATMTNGERMNTLTLDLVEELGRALDLAGEAKARALIVTGSSRAFCCGAHLRYFSDADSPIGHSPAEVRDNYLVKIALLFDRLEAMPFPTIAAINGFALGGGCELALSCDLRIFATSARFGLPETRLGAIPGAGGVQKLARFVGRGKALEWILLGTHLPAEEAARHGLATDVVHDAELAEAALSLARRFKALSPLALAQAKSSIYASESTDLRTARRFGLEALAVLVGSPDWREGMSAFRDKREPRFD